MHYAEALANIRQSSRDLIIMDSVAAIENQMNEWSRQIAKLLNDLERRDKALNRIANFDPINGPDIDPARIAIEALRK